MNSEAVVSQRPLGDLDLTLSQVSFGSMRLDAAAGVDATAKFLSMLFDRGVDTHHSSFEYDSYGLYSAAASAMRKSGRDVKHIVKLAEPSFDDLSFDPGRFVAAIDRELAALGTDTIANVQWLVRTPEPVSPSAEHALVEGLDVMREAADQLVAAGKIRSVSVFPYSAQSANEIVRSASADAQCIYLNLAECGDLNHLEAKPTIALRPVSGGALSGKNPYWASAEGRRVLDRVSTASGLSEVTDIAQLAVLWPLLHESVATVVVSLGEDLRLSETLALAGVVQADMPRFLDMRSGARNLPQREELLAAAMAG